MTLREQHHDSTDKFISFTNGFPRKEMVPTEGLSAGVKVHGGFFVGLHDSATSCLTNSQRTIPPLAKKRANAFALKPRASSSRYRSKKDPFGQHKGTEKIGFTPQSIKRSKPKLEKKRSKTGEHSTSNTTIIDTKLVSKLPRPTDHPPISTLENNAAPKNQENCNDCGRILSDVEKKTTLNELIGIDEVYQNVCKGNMDSVYSLVSPVKAKKKIRNPHSTQYIQTSSPLLIKQKPLKSPAMVITGLESEPKTEEASQTATRKVSKKQHCILLPLPYFPNPPKPPNTAPAYSKVTHNQPKVYPSRLQKQRSGIVSSLSGWCSPSVIDFSLVNLPDDKRPVSRACAPTGSILGVPNKSQTGKVAIVAALDVTATPPATAESEACPQGLYGGENINEINRKWESSEVDSLYSEQQSEINENNVKDGCNNLQGETPPNDVLDNDKSTSKENTQGQDHGDIAGQLGYALSIMLNVIDDSGTNIDVEIYDPHKRDVEKEEQVNKEVMEAEQNQEKKRQELESLLNEHDSLVQQANELSKGLQD